MSNISPGAPLPQRGGDTKVKTQFNAVLNSEGVINADIEVDSFSRNIGDSFFTILQAHVVEIDWLELGREGHRRAKLVDESWQWLNP